MCTVHADVTIPDIRHICVLPAAYHAPGTHRSLRTGHQSLRFSDFHSVSLRKFIYLLGTSSHPHPLKEVRKVFSISTVRMTFMEQKFRLSGPFSHLHDSSSSLVS